MNDKNYGDWMKDYGVEPPKDKEIEQPVKPELVINPDARIIPIQPVIEPVEDEKPMTPTIIPIEKEIQPVSDDNINDNNTSRNLYTQPRKKGIRGALLFIFFPVIIIIITIVIMYPDKIDELLNGRKDIELAEIYINTLNEKLKNDGNLDVIEKEVYYIDKIDEQLSISRSDNIARGTVSFYKVNDQYQVYEATLCVGKNAQFITLSYNGANVQEKKPNICNL